MSYLTLKEAAEATGFNETTIRRLCKRQESKPFIQFKKAKNGIMYTVQANYLFSVYPPLQSDRTLTYTRVDNGYTSTSEEPIQDYTGILAAKDEIIQLLKSETAYLRSENTGLREENRELKLLLAPGFSSNSSPAEAVTEQKSEQNKKSFWQRLFG